MVIMLLSGQLYFSHETRGFTDKRTTMMMSKTCNMKIATKIVPTCSPWPTSRFSFLRWSEGLPAPLSEYLRYWTV